jgi:AcrR family transcriptional regulator
LGQSLKSVPVDQSYDLHTDDKADILANSAMSQLADIDPGKALILQAAADCFKEAGFNATSIDDVAARLSSTKGRIYHHYRSKADLFFDVHRTGMKINLGTLEPVAKGNAAPKDKFIRMCEVHVYNMLHSINFQRVVMQGVEMHLAGRTTQQERDKLALLMEEREKYEMFFQDVLLEGRQRGVFSFDNPSFASKAVLAILNNPVIWYQKRDDENETSRKTIIDQFAQFALKCVSGNSVKPTSSGVKDV